MEEQQQPQPTESFAHRHHHSAESIVTLLEWLLVAFILALVFQGFGVQAFQIPTGSMAETLRGAHYRFRCYRCGHEFDTGKGGGSLDRPQCPNCGYHQPPQAFGPVKNGDRIFVLKCIYQFYEPQRWDVVVFKNPTGPKDNFIKRLIGLPGETVQLIGGDVYIGKNGRKPEIMRKPLNVQQELWMPIFIQDHQPLSAEHYFNEQIREGEDRSNDPWLPPFVNDEDSNWQLHPTQYRLNDPSGRRHTITFRSNDMHEFRANYAYNNSAYRLNPICSDLMITFYAKGASPDGVIGASLEKYGILYSAQIDFAGRLMFTQTIDGVTSAIGRPMLTGPITTETYQRFEFANVDRQLVLRWGDKRFFHDLSNDETFQDRQPVDRESPTVKIFAAGPAEVRHIGLYRDIYYIGEKSLGILRATQENPFTLDEDQFFVCGDNSNDSADSRIWESKGIGNNGVTYRKGIVPREYMMGKAVMVYWSQAFRPAQFLPPMIPNLGNIKVIYGGSEQMY